MPSRPATAMALPTDRRKADSSLTTPKLKRALGAPCAQNDSRIAVGWLHVLVSQFYWEWNRTFLALISAVISTFRAGLFSRLPPGDSASAASMVKYL
jgi:hypothetical protein